MRSSVKVAIVVLAPIVSYFGYDSVMGHMLVHQLCAKDGGLKVYETTFVEGYLDESVGDELYCSACFERLGERQFEYIDVHVPGDPAVTHPLAIRPGYYRYSLAARGDPGCERWKSNVNLQRWAQMRRRAGIPDDQCVAVEALPGRPEGAVLTHTVRGHSNRGIPSITVDEWSIASTTTGRLTAELREYLFHSRWDSVLSFGPTNPAARCFAPDAKVNAMRSLVPATLRDHSR